MAEVIINAITLLTFEDTSLAFTKYKPKASHVTPSLEDEGELDGSPPRKTARLAGDLDHSSSLSRAGDKGKGKQKELPRTLSGALAVTVSNAPDQQISDDFVDKQLRKLHNCIAILLSGTDSKSKPLPLSYESMYQATRSAVIIGGKGKWLYEKLKFELKECAGRITKHLEGYRTTNEVAWASELVDLMTWLGETIGLLEEVLTYLDRVFIKQNTALPSIRQTTLSVFATQVLGFTFVNEKIHESVKEWATYERKERKPHPKRATIARLAEQLGSNYDGFDTFVLVPYVEHAQDFYTEEAKQLCKADGGTLLQAEFVAHCKARGEEELTRCQEVFPSFERSWGQCVHVTEVALLQNRIAWLSHGIVAALEVQNVESLVNLYEQLGRVDGLKVLCQAFKAQVHSMVQEIVMDKEKDDEMVERMLKFKNFLDKTLPIAFPAKAPPIQDPSSSTLKANKGHQKTKSTGSAVPGANREFYYAATDGFRNGFRARKNKPAEMIAKFLDRAMRKGQKGASDEEFATMIDGALSLYRFTEDKDVFRTFYHKALAKRLLMERSASDDFEKAVLKNLRENYDGEFNMGDQMFTDLALSRDLNADFHDKAIGQGRAEKLNVMILQRSFWPFTARQTQDILLPVDMQEDLSKFTTYYHNMHKNRRLDFDHSLGTVSLQARFKAGKKELSVSLYQAITLMLFNEQDEIPYAEIQAVTRLETGDLKRTLQSLACGNKKVLRKKPHGRDIDDTDVFVFNADFTDSRQKVHINSIQRKETPEETKHTQDAIESDRKHYLDAAIVRIMKAKKVMPQQQLVPATIDTVKNHFSPDVKMIKERIAKLMEEEYLRRDDDNRELYHYVA